MTGEFSKININKYVNSSSENTTIGSLLHYTIIIENISHFDLESVYVVEDIMGGLVYKEGSLTINGITPFGGDINLNNDAIIPIGLIRATPPNTNRTSKIVITFDVIIDNIPCQYPISSYTRVVYKYYDKDVLITNIGTSNDVSIPFDIPIVNSEFIQLVDDKTMVGKSLGDNIEFKIILQPSSSIKNVTLCDYLNPKLDLESLKVIRNGNMQNIDINDCKTLSLGNIYRGELVEILLSAKVKDNYDADFDDGLEYNSFYEFIPNKATINYINGFTQAQVCGKTNNVYIYVHFGSLKASFYEDKENISIGDVITYFINLKHCGSTLLKNITVTDILPEYLQYVDGSCSIIYNKDIPRKTEFNQKTGQIKIPIIDLGEEVTLLFKTFVLDSPTDDLNKIENNISLSYSYLKDPNAQNPEDRYQTINNQKYTSTIEVLHYELFDNIQNSDEDNEIDNEIDNNEVNNTEVDNNEIVEPFGHIYVDDIVGSVENNNDNSELEEDDNHYIDDIDDIEYINMIEDEDDYDEYEEDDDNKSSNEDNSYADVDVDVTNTDTITIFNKFVDKVGQTNNIATTNSQIDNIIQFQNHHDQESFNVVLKDTIPNNLSYLPGTLIVTPPLSEENIIEPSEDNNLLVLNFGTLPESQICTIKYSTKIDKEIESKDIVSNANLSYCYSSNAHKTASYRSSTVADLINKTIFSNEVVTNIYVSNLDIIEISSPYKVNINTTTDHTIVIKNTGDCVLNNIFVTDLIPGKEMEYVPNSLKINGKPSNYNLSNGVLVGSLDIYDPETDSPKITLSYKLNVNSIPSSNPLEYSIKAEYTYTSDSAYKYELDGKAQSDTYSIYISSADLLSSFSTSVDKVGVTNNSKGANQNIKYIIQFENTGNVTATNVVLKDKIPEQLEYVPRSAKVTPQLPSDHISEPTRQDKELQINIGSVGLNENYQIEFDSKIKEDVLDGTILNNADLNYSYSSGLANQKSKFNARGTSNTTTTTVLSPNIQIKQSIDKSEVSLNTPITYTLNLINTGNVVANNIYLNDILPPHLKYVPDTLSINGVETIANPENGLLIGSLGVYNEEHLQPTATVIFTAVSITIPQINPVQNTVSAIYTHVSDILTGEEISYHAKSNEEKIKIVAADLVSVESTKQSSVNTFFKKDKLNTKGKFTITLFNSGNTSALNVKILDELPDGLDFIHETVSVVGVNNKGNKVPLVVNGTSKEEPLNIENGIAIESIPPLVKVSISYEYKITPTAPDTIESFAMFKYSYICGNNTVNSLVNKTTTETIYIADDSIKVSKYLSPESVLSKTPILYTINITNPSQVPIGNVILQDNIPRGTSLLSSSFTLNFLPFKIDNNGVTAYLLEQGVNIGTIAAGGSLIVQYQVMLDSNSKLSTVENTASVSCLNKVIPLSSPNPVVTITNNSETTHSDFIVNRIENTVEEPKPRHHKTKVKSKKNISTYVQPEEESHKMQKSSKKQGSKSSSTVRKTTKSSTILNKRDKD